MGEGNCMSDIESARAAFVSAILDTEEYRTYARECEKIKQYPELKVQIDDYRKQNYELQINIGIDFETLDSFEKEYETFRENPLVADFLAAELGFCRMMQRLNLLITADLHFE